MRLYLFALFLFLCCSPRMSADSDEGDFKIIEVVVRHELKSLRMSSGERICLALPFKGSHSPIGRDPSPELIRFLATAGISAQGVSVCNKAFSGMSVEFESISHQQSKVEVSVDVADYHVAKNEHFGTLLRSRKCVLKQNSSEVWRIRSCEAVTKP